MSYRQGYIQSLAVGRAAHETEKALVGEIERYLDRGAAVCSGQTHKRGRSMKMNAANESGVDIDAEDICYDAQEDWTKAYETLRQREGEGLQGSQEG